MAIADTAPLLFPEIGKGMPKGFSLGSRLALDGGWGEEGDGGVEDHRFGASLSGPLT